MQSFSSSAPAPGPDRGASTAPSTVPVPGPQAVPPQPSGGRRLALWGGLGLVAAAAIGVTAYQYTRSDSKFGGKTAGPAVPLVAIAAGDVHETIRATGTVSAQNYARLVAPRIQGSRNDMNRGGPGRGGPGGGGLGAGHMGDFSLVLMTLTKAGAQVKPGDVVASFDPQMQQQRLDDYRDAVVQNENMVRRMMANLAAVREAHDQTVRTSKANWDKAVLDLQTAPIRSAIDAEKLKLMVEETDATHKQLVDESAMVIESQSAQIRATQLNQQQTRIELRRAEANVQKMMIKAPMAGVVVMPSIIRNGELGQVREGDQVNPGQTFMQIVDPRSMVLNASVNQVDAARLRLGMKATVRLDAYPTFASEGTLVGIGAMSKTSTFRAGYVGEIPILIKIERPDALLIPDLTGNAEIVLNSEPGTLVAPREAVFQEAGAAFVFLQGPQGWLRRKVELGLANNTSVALRSGVAKGDRIALQRPM